MINYSLLNGISSPLSLSLHGIYLIVSLDKEQINELGL